jgi:hypothetical protein
MKNNEWPKKLKIPIFDVSIVRDSKLRAFLERIANLERDFKLELVSKRVWSKMDVEKLKQIGENATEKALKETIKENRLLKAEIVKLKSELNHGKTRT